MKKLSIFGGASALVLAVAAYAAPGDGRAKMDADGNGAISKSEAMAAADMHFKKMDVDGNGVLDKGDKEAKIKAHFSKMDADGNGAVTEAEFMAAHEARMEKREGRKAAMGEQRNHKMGKRGHGGKGGWMKADTNGDKAISQAEFRAAAQARFSKQDTDGNGEVTKEERQAAHKTMRGEHHRDREAG